MIHTNLPEYWIVEMPNNPHSSEWREIIDYLNVKYGSDWSGDCMRYYGYDGNNNGGSDCSDGRSYFQNDPVLITIDEWHRCINQSATYEIF
jgi:hypothetical protein